MAHDPHPGRDPVRDGDIGDTPDGRVRGRDRKANGAKLMRALYILCALVLLLDFVWHRHAEAGIDGIPGFYAVYGFVGSVVLVLAARQMRKLLRRPEDYYDD